MQENLKRDPTEPFPDGGITDLPGRERPRIPRDLPSPRHRPGEPIMYDPPVESGRDPALPMGNSVADPFTGRPLIDPMQ